MGHHDEDGNQLGDKDRTYLLRRGLKKKQHAHFPKPTPVYSGGHMGGCQNYGPFLASE